MIVNPGDIVTVDFPGAVGVKRRPAVVVSTDTFHSTRPDVVLALLTSRTSGTMGPTDYLLQDWSASGLHKPSAFRAFMATLPAVSISVIGHLSDRDWREVQARLCIALAVT
ncbi:MAG: type II toxin-antitoxin system PemK/MazF family toxin [Candidatus Brocadiales bacterium]